MTTQNKPLPDMTPQKGDSDMKTKDKQGEFDALWKIFSDYIQAASKDNLRFELSVTGTVMKGISDKEKWMDELFEKGKKLIGTLGLSKDYLGFLSAIFFGVPPEETKITPKELEHIEKLNSTLHPKEKGQGK